MELFGINAKLRSIFFHLLTPAGQGVWLFVVKKDVFFLLFNLVCNGKDSTFAPAFQENNAAAKRQCEGGDEEAFFEDIE